MKWYIQAIKNYFNFSGRARRKEYWMFFLFNMIFGIAAMFINRMIGSNLSIAGQSIGYGIVSLLYNLFILIPSLSISFRRLHDIGKSAGWLFIGFVPFAGAIWLFIYSCMSGTVGTNKYGDDPKII